MSPRKPNMLEAFQRSAREDQAKQGQGSGKGAEVDRPKEDPPPKPAARAVPEEVAKPEDIVSDDVFGLGPHGRARFALPFPSWIPLAVALVLLGMAGTWWIGKLLAGSGETHAKESGSEELLESFERDLVGPAGAGETEVNPEAPPIAEDEELTEEDRRFLDPANRFTVRAIYFDNDSLGWQRAIATYRHLRASGLPAIAPITQEKTYILCVGAEPAMNDTLNQIRDQLRSLPGPPPQNEPGAFADAFFVNIDDYLDR